MLPTFKIVIFATDLGPSAPAVLRHALSLARAYGGQVFAVHVLESLGESARHVVDLYAGEGTAGHTEERRWRELQEALRTRVQAICEGERCRDEDGRELVAGIGVVRGKPAEAILAEAARVGADAIVMGSHGHTAVGELLLGSTAHKVAQKSRLPVLLVRDAARPRTP